MRKPFVGAAWLVALTGSALLTPVQGQATRQGLLSLEDARIFYELVGSGEPIMVVHGGPGLDHRYLRPGLDALATQRTLVYYDQRATGRSSAAVEEAVIHIDAFVADIEALREALGHDRIVLLGHSFGALVALEYALRHQDRLRALVLMNPAEPGARFREETARRQAAARSDEDRARLDDLRGTEGFQARDPATLSEFYRVAFRGSFRDPRRAAQLRMDLLPETARNGQDVARLLGTSMGQIDHWERLPLIRIPTLVVHGRFDAPPVEMAEALAAALPNGTLSVLETGHFPFVEDPTATVAAVAGFLARVGG